MVISSAGIVAGASLHPLKEYPLLTGASSNFMLSPYAVWTVWYSAPSTLYIILYLLATYKPSHTTSLAGNVFGKFFHPLKV